MYFATTEQRGGGRSGRTRRAFQGGVALAIVVWFIAGMSLLVAGIVYQAKMDTRMAQLHVAGARVAAAGDGGIQLMMAALMDGRLGSEGKRVTSARDYRLGEHSVTVILVPSTGLINLNAAPLDLLVDLFEAVGLVEGPEAELLADNVIKWRSSRSSGGGSRRFGATEDLLRVEGFDRVRMEALRDYVVAGSRSGSGVDPALAPDGVLGVFARKDPDKAAAISADRQRMSERETTAGQGGRGDNRARGPVTESGFYRADAVVLYGGQRWLRRRWVRVGGSAHSRLPWHYTGTEAPRVLPSE